MYAETPAVKGLHQFIRVSQKGKEFEFAILQRGWFGVGPKKWKVVIKTGDYDYGYLYSEFRLQTLF